MTYQESLDWLYSTQLFGIKLGLEHPRRLLREYLAFPPIRMQVIHVAGTNGKGSVCAFIDAVARSTGRRVGLFTSPHLVDFRERVRVSTVEISEEATAGHLTALRELVAGWDPHPTFFELTLTLAMKHFVESRCDLLVLETGMGGRLDATTAVPADVAVITPVALDHQQWLGNDLAAIAAEKAGIIREGKPVVSAAQATEVRTVLEQTANERRAPLEFVEEALQGYSLGLAGPHQLDNAALALAALHAAGVRLDYDTVKQGLQSTRHGGRFEQVDGPPPLVLDIAHNPSAAAALAATWRQEFGAQQCQLIFGVVADKDPEGILAALLPIAATLHLVPVDSPRALPPAELRARLPADAPPTTVHPDLASALCTISGERPALLTGSAFLVGEAKALLRELPRRTSAQ